MDAGVAVVLVAALVAAVTAFVLRPRLPAVLTVPLMTLSSATLAWGGMLLREDPAAAEVVLAVLAMAVLGPAHVRIVLGPYGTPRD